MTTAASMQTPGRPMSAFVHALLLGTTLLLGALQLYLDPGYDNLMSVGCVVVSSLVCIAYLQGSGCMQDAPVSSFTILGFLITTMLGAMVAKTLEWLPLSSDLKTPVLTFTVLAGAMLGIIGLHWLYRHLLSIVNWRDAFTARWLAPAGLYAAPPPMQLWLMSFFGFYAVMMSRNVAFGDVGGKFISGFTYLAWLPFLVPIFKARGDKAYQAMGPYWIYLGVYAGLLALAGLALNARVIIFSGGVVVGLLALFETLRGRFTVGRWTWLKAIAALGAASVLIVVGDDLATAMVIVRQKTESMSPKQKVKETFDTFMDSSVIALYRDEKESERLALTYDEIYIRNAILARFTETKFHDNALNCATAYTDADRDDLVRATMEKVYAILPTPLMKAIDAKLDKDKLAYSFGDYLCNIKSGVELGGYRTGSIFAHAYALFDTFSWLVLAALFLLKFLALDIYTTKGADGRYIVSPVLMLTIWFNFIGSYSGDSLVQYLDSLTRMLVQQIALYLLLTLTLRGLMGLLKPSAVSEAPERRDSSAWRAWRLKLQRLAETPKLRWRRS